MNEVTDVTSVKPDSTDTLLWLGGLIVVGVGASWLFMSQPWVSEPRTVTAVDNSVSPAQSQAPQASVQELESILDNPLRMARLAFEAGMLVEPENYSAWSLYEKMLADEPGHTEALQGLRDVADVLAQRGNAAFEQGRSEDAQLIADQILAALPDHSGALRLAADLEDAAERSRAQAARANEDALAALATTDIGVTPVVAAETPAAEPIPVDPIPEIQANFDAALADNRLLTPEEQNAKFFVALMATINAEDERVIESRRLLFSSLIQRAEEAIELQDTQAATIWIDEAELLDVDPTTVSEVRTTLTAHLIEMESQKRVPASALERIEYAAPDYPSRAHMRGVEGWVDLEFIIAADGATQDVTITESSHESYFRREALAAVEQWHFEPRIFMDQPIEQRSYTRVIFQLQ